MHTHDIEGKVLELLKQQPQTANGLSKTLQHDKAAIRTLLLIMERQGFVECKPKKRGKVTYKFWQVNS